MARRKRPAAAEQEAHARREERLTALHEQLRAGVDRLTAGQEWRAWLDVASRFHSYSFNNTLLITLQRPDATHVAGYRVWQQLGRQVDKGEKGIRILAPVIRRTPANPGDDPSDTSDADPAAARRPRVAGFRAAHVFDVSQTTGDPLPEPAHPTELAGQPPSGLWDQLAGQVVNHGFDLRREPCQGARNGYTDFLDRLVVVRDDLDGAQAVKTLAHELGHVLLHGPDQLAPRDTRVCRGTAEVEAESVAYLVAAAHGLDVSDYTFPYVARWAASVTGGDPERVAATVQRAATHALHAAHTVLEQAELDSAAVASTATATSPDRGPAQSPDAVQELWQRTQSGQRAAAELRERADALAGASKSAPGSLRRPVSAPADLGYGRLLEANAAAADWWTEQLAAAPAARAYLQQRRVTVGDDESPWQPGYADDSWTGLVDALLRSGGFTGQELVDAGLAQRSRRGTVIDRFRERIMLPIRRPDGAIVGFVGRATPAADTTAPKYLNTPTTAAFRKGGELFGLAEQAEALQGGATAVLVEGPFDVLALSAHAADHGTDAVGVTPSGTALTREQVALLAQHASRVAVAFDGDEAGLRAAERAYQLLRAAYPDPQWIPLPAGTDPSSLHVDDTAALARLLDQPTCPLADASVDRALASHDLREGGHQVVVAVRHVANTIAQLPTEQWARQAGRAAERLGLEPAAVTEALTEAAERQVHEAGRALGRDTSDDLDPSLTAAAAPYRRATALLPPNPSPRSAAPPGHRSNPAAQRPSSPSPAPLPSRALAPGGGGALPGGRP